MTHIKKILKKESVLIRKICVCVCMCVLVAQSCLTLCDLVDYNPPVSSVHGIFQARTLD